MATTVAEVMAHDPVTVSADAPLSEAAQHMRASDAGDVLVMDSGRLAGIITDRNIAIRVVAENKPPRHRSGRPTGKVTWPLSPPIPHRNTPPN